MTKHCTGIFLVTVLFLAPKIGFGAEKPQLTVTDYNAALELGRRYFIGYLNDSGDDMRMKGMLNVCHQDDLVGQIERSLPPVFKYVVQSFTRDTNKIHYDAPDLDMALSASLVTQSLSEGYQIGYAQSLKSDTWITKNCSAMPKVFEMYLKEKSKKR